jgi:hypothetical protein
MAYAPPENFGIPSEEDSDVSIDELLDKISTKMMENHHHQPQEKDT